MKTTAARRELSRLACLPVLCAILAVALLPQVAAAQAEPKPTARASAARALPISKSEPLPRLPDVPRSGPASAASYGAHQPAEETNLVIHVRMVQVPHLAQGQPSGSVRFQPLPDMPGVSTALVVADGLDEAVGTVTRGASWRLMADSDLHATSGGSTTFRAWGKAGERLQPMSVRLKLSPTALSAEQIRLAIARLDDSEHDSVAAQRQPAGEVTVHRGQWLVLSGLFPPSRPAKNGGLQIPVIGQVSAAPLLGTKPAEPVDLVVLIRPEVMLTVPAPPPVSSRKFPMGQSPATASAPAVQQASLGSAVQPAKARLMSVEADATSGEPAPPLRRIDSPRAK